MSDNFVGMIREIAEEGDLDSILKTSLGGYTKKSVKEYLSFIKKQQQNLKDAYTGAAEQLQNEKDGLQREISELKARNEEAADTMQLRLKEQAERLEAERASLEADMDEAISRIAEDGEKLRKLENALADETQRSEQYRQEISTVRIQLDSANARITDQEAQLSAQAAELAALKDTEHSLRSALAEDRTADLKARIQELLGSVAQLQDEVAIRDRELETRAMRLEALSRQEQSNHSALEELQLQLQRQREQNEWIESENEELGKRLQEQMEQSIALSRENAHLKAANAIAQRKLDLEFSDRRTAEVGIGSAQ